MIATRFSETKTLFNGRVNAKFERRSTYLNNIQTMPEATTTSPSKRRRSTPLDNGERRGHILAAAQRVFEAKGLEGANMRAIAREAGYTPGALYFYYASQEEIYADLLSTSLGRLHEFTRAAGAEAVTPGDLAVARALAFYDYYAVRPDELSLGFYLFKGIGPHGLTRELNEGLNGELWSALSGVYHPLVESGRKPDQALTDLTALFGHGVGLLLLVTRAASACSAQDGREMFRAFVEERVLGRRPAKGGK